MAWKVVFYETEAGDRHGRETDGRLSEEARTMRTLDDLKAQLRQDPEFVREYEALEPEYQVARAVLDLRLQRGFSQAELAERAGTKQASVSRVERAETVPSLTLLKKLAAALDTRVEIRLVPRD
jgi:ribosome-binding protein aMBF1 (putative translation factor)